MIHIPSFVVFSVVVVGYVKKIKWYSLQGSVFNYVFLPQQLCNSKFHSVSQPFDGFILIEPAWAQDLESALTCLVIRTIYGETMAAPQFTVIGPVGNSPYKTAGEKTSSDTVSHWNPDRLCKKNCGGTELWPPRSFPNRCEVTVTRQENIHHIYDLCLPAQ